MTREQWKAVWRWMRIRKKQLAWQMGPTFPEAPYWIKLRSEPYLLALSEKLDPQNSYLARAMPRLLLGAPPVGRVSTL